MSAPRPVTMADLTPKTRVRHIHWNCTGTIAAAGGVTEIRWDNSFVADEVSPEGVVFPRRPGDHREEAVKITLNWRHAVAATLLALGFAMFATTIADNYGVLFAMPPSAITLSEACRVFASFVLSIVVINSSLDAMPAHPRGDR